MRRVTWHYGIAHSSGPSSNDARTGWWRGNIPFPLLLFLLPTCVPRLPYHVCQFFSLSLPLSVALTSSSLPRSGWWTATQQNSNNQQTWLTWQHGNSLDDRCAFPRAPISVFTLSFYKATRFYSSSILYYYCAVLLCVTFCASTINKRFPLENSS